MTVSSDLVARLRAYRSCNEWGDPVHHTICDEAADALAASEADASELRALEAAIASLRQQLAASQAREAEAYERAAKVALRKPDSFGDAIPTDRRFRDGWIQASMRVAAAIRALTGEVDDAR